MEIRCPFNYNINQVMLYTGCLLTSTACGSAAFSTNTTTKEEILPTVGMPITTTIMPLSNNEWLQYNMSQIFNISANNLSRLFKNIQQQQPLPTAERATISLLVTLTTCYVFIFLAGILGNLITCIVISKNKFMHTATNFYLFNLAISDLILLLSGMPQDLYNLWYPYSYPFSDMPCIIESVLSETAANATVLTVTAFTVERYIAICHPFRQHTMSKLSRAIKFIFGIWLSAFLLALPQAMQFSVVPYNGGTECTINNDFFAHVFAISGFLFFGGPMTAICALYVLIGVKLKHSRLLQTMPRRCYDVQRGISAQTRVIRMLIAVAVAFFLCWAPFHAQRLMAVYGSMSGIDSQIFNTVFHILDYASGVLYFLSTCINPLLYNIMSHKFRDAFKVTLARQLKSNKPNHHSHHNLCSTLLRRNGSLRSRRHATVNNNALEHYSSFRIMQLHCRDPKHNLSLQDSIRTNTTTTTVNSSTGGTQVYCRQNQSQQPDSRMYRSSRYNRRLDSQSTLTSREVNCDRLPSTSIPLVVHGCTLQTQISQLSSLGDANSLLEIEVTNSEPVYHMNEPPKYSCKKSDEHNSEYVSMYRQSGTSRDSTSLPFLPERSLYGYSPPLQEVAVAGHLNNAVLMAMPSIKTVNSEPTCSQTHKGKDDNNSCPTIGKDAVTGTSKLALLGDKFRWRRRRRKKVNSSQASNKVSKASIKHSPLRECKPNEGHKDCYNMKAT